MRAASIERPRDSGGGAASASHGFWSHSIADGPTTVAPLTEASDARAVFARRNEDDIYYGTRFLPKSGTSHETTSRRPLRRFSEYCDVPFGSLAEAKSMAATFEHASMIALAKTASDRVVRST